MFKIIVAQFHTECRSLNQFFIVPLGKNNQKIYACQTVVRDENKYHFISKDKHSLGLGVMHKFAIFNNLHPDPISHSIDGKISRRYIFVSRCAKFA